MNIYFSGLGGVGIGPLVEIALDAGYQVQGSDLVETLETARLRERGVAVSIGLQDGLFLRECHEAQPIDLLIYTAALPPEHTELQVAKELGIRTVKRDEFTNQLIQDKNLKLLAVAGTHGKTTTTGMLIWTLERLGVPISYLIGTTLSFGPSGHFDPDSHYLVYECDEFDRNFLHFSPYLSLLPTVDYDHPDTYPTPEDYAEAFRTFIDQSEHVIAWKATNDAYVHSAATNAWFLSEDEVSTIALVGAHNRRNATLVLKAVEYLGLDKKAAYEALLSFPGTDRRFEALSDNLYTDYGHHPVEIAATLELASELSDHIVLVYQPHQNIRQHELKDQYTDQFEKAEVVYWLPTYLSREDPNLPILSPAELFAHVTNRDRIHEASLDDALWQTIQAAREEGKLVLCMGAGSIDSWLRDRLAA